MKLPHHNLAVVPRTKVTNYLLSSTHVWGRHKAAFFAAIGFSAKRPEELIAALQRHAAANDVAKTEVTLFGTRYVIEGIMEGPKGRTANLRAVWFLAAEGDVPCFVTAYPIRGVR
jgi:hypothetical protein